MARYITVPSGKSVPLSAYVAAWKRVKALDPDTEVNGWEWYAVSASDVLRALRRGLHDRITQAIPYSLRA